MKPISRRSAASVLAGIPFIGGAAAKQFAQGQVVGSMRVGQVEKAESANQMPLNGTMPQGPKMQEWQAARLAMSNPEIREFLTANAYAQNRVVASVDPDIEIYRSFSPMAKITFQRQRNVQRMLDQAQEEPMWSLGEKAREYIRKLMWG